MSALSLSALLLSLVAGPLDDYQRDVLPTGRLYWRGWAEADRRDIAQRVPRTLAEVERRLGRQRKASFDVVLATDGFEFQRVVKELSGRALESDSVWGVAIPALHLLVLRGGLAQGGGGFRETLVHEVAHLVIHAAGKPVPRWLDEGVANWVSGHTLTPRQNAYIAFLARTDGLYSLTQIEKRFPGGHLPTAVAYQQSLLFVTYLVEVYGDAVVRRLLELSARELGTREIIEEVAAAPFSSVEKRFVGWLLSRMPLGSMVIFLVDFWTVCGLLALVAIVRFVLRRRRRLRELAREDAREDAETDLDDFPSSSEEP